MAADRAPDPQTLRRFLLGELPEADLEAVGAYLRDHPDALDRVETPPDTLLTALRDSSTLSDLDAPDMRGLIDQLTTLSPAGGPAATADEDPAAALAPPERPGDLGRLGGYRVLRVLGRGGMGVVFEAEDPRLGRKVALKVMTRAAAGKPGAGQRFLREARAAAAVDHDHITPIFQVGEDRGVPYLAMPLLRGETLDERLQCGPPLSQAEVVEIGRQTAEGLAAAHAAGLIHRDVKPSNVWLERAPDGSFKRVRLLDFGLAKAAADPTTAGGSGLTRTGMILGTPTFMAPEQARGLAVDARADLFSLGCVLYQMATGRRPFDGADAVAVVAAVMVDTPPPARAVNPAVLPALSALIDRLLAKDPAARPPSARAVAEELARIAATPAPRRRRVWPWVAAAVLLALAGASAYFGKTIIRVASNRGELVIEVDDPNVEVTVKDGQTTVHDKTRERSFVLTAGDGEVTFLDPATGAKAATKAFTITRGGTAVVRATVAEVTAARPPANGAPPPWIKVLKTDGWFSLSPDGKQLAVPLGDDRPDVLVFDTATAALRQTLPGRTLRAFRSAFTPDGKRLVTAHVTEKVAVVWDLATARPVHTIEFGQPSLAVAVRPDGKQIAVGGLNGARAYDAATWASGPALNQPGDVHGLAYAPAGDLLASASQGNTVRVWNADTGAAVRAFEVPGPMTGVAFSPDGKRLAAGGDTLLRVWEVGSWKEVLARDRVAAGWVGFGPDPNVLWSGPWPVKPDPDPRPRRWDLTTGTSTVLTVPPLKGWASFALSPDGAVLYAADSFTGVWACDSMTGRPKPPPAGK